MRIDLGKTNTRKLLFGMAFAWSLFFVAPIFQDAYIPLDGIYARGNLCLNLAAAITAEVLLALMRRGRKIHCGVLQAGGILFAVGNVMNYVSAAMALLPLGFVYLSSFFEGIGLVCILSVWASKLSSLNGRSFCVVLVGSYLLGAVILTIVVLIDRMANLQVFWLVYVCLASILSAPLSLIHI